MSQHAEKASDRTRALSQLDKLQEAQIDKAINQLAATVEGRRFLWWLLQVGKVGTQPFAANALNMSFNCGELNVGNTILARIATVNPAVYVRMQQENENERRSFDSNYDDAGNAINSGNDSGSDTGGTY